MGNMDGIYKNYLETICEESYMDKAIAKIDQWMPTNDKWTEDKFWNYIENHDEVGMYNLILSRANFNMLKKYFIAPVQAKQLAKNVIIWFNRKYQG